MNRQSQPGAPRISTVAMLAWAAFAAAVGFAEGRPPVSFSNEEPVPATGTLAPAVTGSAAPFARVRYQEGGVEVGHGSESQAVGVNYPVFAGESVATDSGQRVELQLPDGTLLRVDRETRIAFDDFSARDGGTSVVALAVGQIQLTISDARGGDSLRIDTPSASIYPLDASSLRIDVDPGDMVRVSVTSGRVEVAAETGSVVLVSGERTVAGPGAAPRDPWRYASGTRDNFDAWTAERDAENPATYVAGDVGAEYEALPEEVQPYYGELSDNGNWVYTEDYGWAFQPNVGSSWQPYQDGQWYPSPAGDPVWVGTEPWGWVTWRYGSWDFNAGLGGWIWLPGAVWGPANVWWYYGSSYVGWVPVGYWGWPVYGCCGYWGNPWFDYCPWTFVGYDDFWHHPVPRAAVPRDRILNPELDRGVVSREAIPAPDGRRARATDRAGREPRETLDRGVYERARARAERGDRDVRPVPRGTVQDEMRRERGAGARGPRGAGGTDTLPSGRRDATGRRSGEKAGGAITPPAPGVPRGGSGGGSAVGRETAPRSPGVGTPRPVAPNLSRVPRRTLPEGSGDREPGRASRAPGSTRTPEAGGAGAPSGGPRAPRTFPRTPEGSAAPRQDESVRRFFGRLKEDTRLAPRAPRPSPLRPGSGVSRPQSAAPAPRVSRPQAQSPSAPKGATRPQAPAAGPRGSSGGGSRPPVSSPRSGGSAPRSAPAPRSGGGSGTPSSGGSRGGGGGGKASPKR